MYLNNIGLMLSIMLYFYIINHFDFRSGGSTPWEMIRKVYLKVKIQSNYPHLVVRSLLTITKQGKFQQCFLWF